jgi:hypothetical protein
MNKPVSRQRLYQLKLKAEGRCEHCAKELHPVHKTCESCASKRRERLRQRKGYKPKVMGGPGRPIKGADETENAELADMLIKMSKVNYSLLNSVIAEDMQVSESTVARYRKIFAPTIRQQSELEHKMARADYSLADIDLMYVCGVSRPTVAKYRKIYGSK